MKSVSAKRLYSYWQKLRGNRPAPERRDIEPAAIKSLLSDIFILEHEAAEQFSFRLAGSALCTAYCRELKGRSFRQFWPDHDLEALDTTLLAIREEAAASVIAYDAINSRGQTLAYEMLLLPLRYGGDDYPRVLGVSTPADMPYWVGVHPVMRHRVTSMRLIWPDEQPAFMRSVVGDDVVSAQDDFMAGRDDEGLMPPRDFGARIRAAGQFGPNAEQRRSAFRVIKGGLS
ncbi:MAG: PAS domain-containing protein [Devosiaceae bacterium]|nr:PAS domain-containing protein [Devosiaceae bacterium MH13]